MHHASISQLVSRAPRRPWQAQKREEYIHRACDKQPTCYIIVGERAPSFVPLAVGLATHARLSGHIRGHVGPSDLNLNPSLLLLVSWLDTGV
jgi:hypothetical protein